MVGHFKGTYSVVITAQVSEMLATFTAGILFSTIGTKATMFSALMLASIAGMVIAAGGQEIQASSAFLILILAAKFGISSAYTTVFIAHTTLFPVMFAATSMGWCNFVARTFNTGAPILSEAELPLPMIVFSVATAVASVLSLFLIVDRAKEVDEGAET